MEIKKILEVLGETGVAFSVVALIQKPLSFLAYEGRIDSEKVVFGTAEGEKALTPDTVKAINPVSIQDLVEEVCRLGKRIETMRKTARSIC